MHHSSEIGLMGGMGAATLERGSQDTVRFRVNNNKFTGGIPSGKLLIYWLDRQNGLLHSFIYLFIHSFLLFISDMLLVCVCISPCVQMQCHRIGSIGCNQYTVHERQPPFQDYSNGTWKTEGNDRSSPQF